MGAVLYIEPVGHDLFSQHFQRVCRLFGPRGIDVDVRRLEGVAASSPFLPANPEFLGPLHATVSAASDTGYDAVVIGCSSDPGLREARRASSIPVVGPFSASLHLAAVAAERVGVITPGPQSEVALLWDWVRWHGLERTVAKVAIAPVDHPKEDSALERLMDEEPGRVRDQILNAHRESVAPHGSATKVAEQLIEEDGVGALVFACTFWGGMLGQLEQRLGVPVLDPCASALWMAAMLTLHGGVKSEQEGSGPGSAVVVADEL